MANYKLGPVIGKIGGGAEVITQQVTLGENQTRTFTLPAGWEGGYIGLTGVATGVSGIGRVRDITIFGHAVSEVPGGGSEIGGFGTLPTSIITKNTTYTGTVTMIKVS